MNKQKISCLVVEDDAPAQWVITNYLKEFPELDLVGCASNSAEAIQILLDDKVDLLILDVNLSGVTSLEILEKIPYQPLIIFTTAFSQYALESFNYNVVDYLVKPITREMFDRAINKVFDRFTGTSVKEKVITHIDVKVDNRMERVSVEDIVFLQSYGNYVKMFLTNKMLLISSTTQDLLKILPSADFIRIHKSYIINRNHVIRIDNNYVYIGEEVLPIGISYRQFVATLY